MITKIFTLKDVKTFGEQLIEEGANFHPDDDFNDYVFYQTELPMYAPKEVEIRNKLMEECFEVCERESEDIYGIMVEILRSAIGLHVDDN